MVENNYGRKQWSTELDLEGFRTQIQKQGSFQTEWRHMRRSDGRDEHDILLRQGTHWTSWEQGSLTRAMGNNVGPSPFRGAWLALWAMQSVYQKHLNKQTKRQRWIDISLKCICWPQVGWTGVVNDLRKISWYGYKNNKNIYAQGIYSSAKKDRDVHNSLW